MAKMPDSELSKLKAAAEHGAPEKRPVSSTGSTPPMRGLSVRVYRHYGAIDIEFGVNAQFSPENEADQMRLWQMLYQQVSDMHDEWAQHELPNVKPLKQAASSSNGGSVPEEREFRAVEVFRIKGDSGYQYRLKTESGTAYGKYGAIIPKELVAARNLNDLLGEDDRLPLNDYCFKVNSKGIVLDIYRKVQNA